MAEVLNLNLRVLSDDFRPILLARNNIEIPDIITYLQEMRIDFQVILLDDPSVTREDSKISNYLFKMYEPFVIFDFGLNISAENLNFPYLITSIGIIDNELGIKLYAKHFANL